nr:PREDICTED: uncharacterized protein LOC109038373 [Bemisia tabaci]
MIAVKILMVAGLFIIGPDLCQPMKPHTSVETGTRYPSPSPSLDQRTHKHSLSPPTQLPSSSLTGEGTNHRTSKGSHVVHTDNHNLHTVSLPGNGAMPKPEIESGLKSPRKGSVSPEKRPLLSNGKTAITTGGKPSKHRFGFITTGFTARNRANADGNGEEPSEKTPLLSKESWDSTGSTDSTSRPKLPKGKGSSVRTFRPPPEFQQDSTASKPELPKPKLPEPELPKSKVPNPKLPMPKLQKQEIAATSMVDHGPDMSSEGSETDELTPEEIEKEQQKQFRRECIEECAKKDGYIKVPAMVVGGGDNMVKTHFLTGKTTDRGKGMRPKCECVYNSAITWFLNQREKVAKKGDAFQKKYESNPKRAAEWLKKQGFEVHYYPAN